MTPTFRIEIDDDACRSHGRCWTVAPELFEPKSGDEGGTRVTATGFDESQRALAERAVQLCPENAILIVEL